MKFISNITQIAVLLLLGVTFTACPPEMETSTPFALVNAKVQPASATLVIGNTLQLTAAFTSNSFSCISTTWVSSNPAVATVSATGLVKAIANGSATITVTLTAPEGSKTTTCAITVLVPDGSENNPFLATTAAELKTRLLTATGTKKIKLLNNITYNEGISINGVKWNFDLNGTTLTVSNASGSGIEVINGGSLYVFDSSVGTKGAGGGALNVNGAVGVYVSGAGSIVTLTGDVTGIEAGVFAENGGRITVTGSATGTGSPSFGVVAFAGSNATVTGNATGSMHGAAATGANAVVTVGGNAVGGNYGAHATDGGSVTVTGNATGNAGVVGAAGAAANANSTIKIGGSATGFHGVVANGANANIEVGGNVTGVGEDGASAMHGGKVTVNGNATGDYSGAYAVANILPATVIVKGDVTGRMHGAIANAAGPISEATIEVGGNVTITAPIPGTSNAAGARATNLGKITIDGAIIATNYVNVGGVVKPQSGYEPTSSKAGYLEYTNGVSAFVWVKN